jgi:hypothetical protein
MKLTRKMLSIGHCQSVTVKRGDLEYNHQLYIEHGAYFIRLIVRESGDIIVNRSYVARAVDCKFSYILSLFKQSIAWSGMCMLYSFAHKGHDDAMRYDVFSDSIDQAKRQIYKMYGIYDGALESLI